VAHYASKRLQRSADLRAEKAAAKAATPPTIKRAFPATT
jgi:hypothetical protein